MITTGYIINTPVSYCPQHDEITIGWYSEHHCEGTIELGPLELTTKEKLEIAIEALEHLALQDLRNYIAWDALERIRGD